MMVWGQEEGEGEGVVDKDDFDNIRRTQYVYDMVIYGVICNNLCNIDVNGNEESSLWMVLRKLLLMMMPRRRMMMLMLVTESLVMIMMMPKRMMMMLLVTKGLGLLAALSDGLGGEDIETGLVASKTKKKAKSKNGSVQMKTFF